MNESQAQALRWLLAGGLGAGVGGGVLAALANASKTKKPMADLATMAPQMVKIPHPKRVEATRVDNRLDDDDDVEKMAGERTWLGYLLGDDFKSAPTPAAPGAGGTPAAPAAPKVDVKSPLSIPLFPLAAVATGLGSAYLGHKLVSDMAKEKRKQDMEQEVADAEEEFNQALLNSYDPKKLGLSKTSMVKEISDGLEKLATILKVSEEPGPITSASRWLHSKLFGAIGLGGDKLRDASGYVTGPALLGLAAVPTSAAYLAYKYYKDRDKTKLLNEAAKARQLARMNENIPEPYVQVEN
jgi:hypothetical protein